MLVPAASILTSEALLALSFFGACSFLKAMAMEASSSLGVHDKNDPGVVNQNGITVSPYCLVHDVCKVADTIDKAMKTGAAFCLDLFQRW